MHNPTESNAGRDYHKYRLSQENFKSMSVFRYFTSELTKGYLLEREEEKYAQKRQRVYTFMNTPRELEKFCTYGFFQCVDAFLFVFTFLPIRILLAFLKMFTHPCGFMRSRKFLEPAQICDILKGIILVVCTFIMSYIDTSMMYHLVRGQSTIKLYVFFNMLDMADRLLSSVGHDILDALFWTATEPRGKKREHLGTLPHLVMAIIYVILHALLILFQATVLNVAFNSFNKSLLVIMMSNNFVEIKANLFKKVDVNHLCQISCSDVKERFHYVILLFVVFVRNMTEVSWDPEHLWVIVPDGLMVLVSELFVDWGKHAFILKFNEITADVYAEFKTKLAVDMASGRHHAFTDHSDLVSRRMGLTPLPLACLLYKTCSKVIKHWDGTLITIAVVFYFCMLTFKVLVSIVLLGQAYKIILASVKPGETSSHQPHEATNEKPDETINQQPCRTTKETSDNAANHESHETLHQNQSDTRSSKKEQEMTKISSNHDSNFDILEEPQSFNIPEKMERRASFGNRDTMEESEIYSVDSYCELTMIPINSPIEASPSHSRIKSSQSSLSSLEDEDFKQSHQPRQFQRRPIPHRGSLDSELTRRRKISTTEELVETLGPSAATNHSEAAECEDSTDTQLNEDKADIASRAKTE